MQVSLLNKITIILNSIILSSYYKNIQIYLLSMIIILDLHTHTRFSITAANFNEIFRLLLELLFLINDCFLFLYYMDVDCLSTNVIIIIFI